MNRRALLAATCVLFSRLFTSLAFNVFGTHRRQTLGRYQIVSMDSFKISFRTGFKLNVMSPREETEFLETRDPNAIEGLLETIVPPIVPILAFFYYDVISAEFAKNIKLIARNTWLSDGSKEPAILAALNSIVLPTSAILYATLTATTVNALRQRQQSVREALNQEASELRILQSLLQYYPETRQERIRFFLIQYTSRVINECSPIINLRMLESRGQDSEISDLFSELNEMVTNDDVEDIPHDILIFQSYDALVRLKNSRGARLSALQNRLPILHYIVLISLALSVTVGFLIETNKARVDFNAFQLRILWTQLVASFSALAVICYDLNFVFGGNYQVKRTTDQLYTIRFSLQREYLEKKQQLENMF